jgi:hypothetical protein
MTSQALLGKCFGLDGDRYAQRQHGSGESRFNLTAT